MKVPLWLVFVCLSTSASNVKVWSNGKLIDYEKTSHPITFTNAATNQVQSVNSVTRYVTIETPELTYYAEFRVHFRHTPELTENSAIKFRVEKDTLWFDDADGKEFKAHIFKRRKP